MNVWHIKAGTMWTLLVHAIVVVVCLCVCMHVCVHPDPQHQESSNKIQGIVYTGGG